MLKTLKELQDKGAVSRVGPVFRPNTVGASTLAAMAVAAEKLETVAAVISDFPQVNHNYEREHHYNLWFVVTAENSAALTATLHKIQQATGHRVLSLPLVRDYHIDLGFRMNLDGGAGLSQISTQEAEPVGASSREFLFGGVEDLIEVIQGGLPLVTRPYREIAQQLGCSEQAVIDKLHGMIEAGIIKRLGVVVRHHELGYRANAMVVWDVPDEELRTIGTQVVGLDIVSHCYHRPRHLPDWPYNLFAMVHGHSQAEVRDKIGQIAQLLGDKVCQHEVLFSTRILKKTGLRIGG